MMVWIDYETYVFCPFDIQFMVLDVKLFFVESDFIIKVNISTIYNSLKFPESFVSLDKKRLECI
jgi:hypothetical protein